MVNNGDDLVDMMLSALDRKSIVLKNGDVIALAQKIVSKSEGRLVDLRKVKAGARAVELAGKVNKDARLVELILQESNEVLRARKDLLIVEHRLGFVCANAGVDHSNVEGGEDFVLLLPENPDASAKAFRQRLEESSGQQIGVMIIDSHGRAWREGVVGVAIGLSGLPGTVDQRGRDDLVGRLLRATIIGAADELAAAASTVMGQAAEGIPAVHIRGFRHPLREGSLKELLRPKERDEFR